jgi:hypothetical protein
MAMRRFLSCLGAVVLAALACAQTRAGDFSLKAESVEALEGGPVVLRLTLTFRGEKPASVLSPCLTDAEGCIGLSAPKEWERIEPWITDGTSHLIGYQTLKQGDRFLATVYAHERFTRIPSGRASLKLSWWLALEGDRGLEVTTKLDLDVPRATPGRLAAVRRRIEAELDRSHHIATDRRGLARWVLRTRHRAFIPLALRMIASRDRVYFLDDLIDFTYAYAELPEEVHRQLVALACDPGWGGTVELFQYWKHHRTALPPQELQNLLGAKHIWTRVLTAVTFPGQFSQGWKAALLRELRGVARPLPPEQFAPLLRDLDDDSFVVRESASARLEQLGERVEAHLQQALRTPLSVEAKGRVRSTLERIAATPRPPDCDRTISYLAESVRTPEADSILTALADGDPHLSLTKYAKTALKQRQKQRSGK